MSIGPEDVRTPRKEKGAAEAAPNATRTQQMVSSTLLAVVGLLAILPSFNS